MKKIGIFVIYLCVGIVLAGPVIIKKPIIGTAEEWEVTGRHYMKVTLADGSKVELKSPKPLTKLEWQKLAEDYQKAIDIPEPEICKTCGQLMP